MWVPDTRWEPSWVIEARVGEVVENARSVVLEAPSSALWRESARRRADKVAALYFISGDHFDSGVWLERRQPVEPRLRIVGVDINAVELGERELS